MTEIGKCSGCSKMSVLTELACKACNSRFGQGCGTQMARIRENPILARMCYDRLVNETARKKFIEWFGTPWCKNAV